jgi:hypothetical protein
MSYKVATFIIDGLDGKFKGIHNPQIRWNGWACPMFTLNVAKKLIKSQCLEDCEKFEMSYYNISSSPNGITENHVDGVEFYPVSVIDGVEYYKIGYMNWVWEVV